MFIYLILIIYSQKSITFIEIKNFKRFTYSNQCGSDKFVCIKFKKTTPKSALFRVINPKIFKHLLEQICTHLTVQSAYFALFIIYSYSKESYKYSRILL